ncbi:helix-turn-helix transcriptional regulator [Cupriavidus taiwanensis]
MAAAAGLTRMHFAASFRAATGKSPHHYLLHRRIEVAQDYLVDGKMPLIDVAFSVGFQSHSHFSSVFKRVTGRTPREWRYTTVNTVDRR